MNNEQSIILVGSYSEVNAININDGHVMWKNTENLEYLNNTFLIYHF